MKCHWCGQDKETGPYGPDGSQVCVDCIQSDPERESIAVEQFWTRLREALAASNVVVIDDNTEGPQPWYPEQQNSQ